MAPAKPGHTDQRGRPDDRPHLSRLLLNETLSPRALVGCALMLAGVIVSQLRTRRRAVSV